MALEFSVAVEDWVRKAKERSDEAYRATVFDALAYVKGITPVRTGFLRANWTVVVGDEAMPVAGRETDPATIIATLHVGDRATIVNPVVYAARVNYGFVGTDSLGRHYDQTGNHMLERTIAALPEIAQRAVERVRMGGSGMPGAGAPQEVPA